MRIEQGKPNPTKSRKKVEDSSADSFQRMIDSIAEERASRVRSVELLAEVVRLLSASLEKLEEIRYGLADSETGISNMLRQMKIMNARLDELVDKRMPSFDKD